MFEGFDEMRLLAMTDQEKRWLDNIKKAFENADRALELGNAEDHCLEELFKGIDTAKTLRRSLRSEDISPHDNKKRFIEFLGLEIPAARPDSPKYSLTDPETGKQHQLTLGEVIYLARCKIHENENLNAAEAVNYHILFDWKHRNVLVAATIKNEILTLNGYFIAHRLREVLSKFITGLEGMIAFAEGRSFSIGIRPKFGSIRPEKRERTP